MLNQLGFMPQVRLGTQFTITEISVFSNMILVLVDHLDMLEENICTAHNYNTLSVTCEIVPPLLKDGEQTQGGQGDDDWQLCYQRAVIRLISYLIVAKYYD